MKTKKLPSKPLPVAILIGSFIISVAIIINAILSYLASQQPKSTDPQKIYENIGYVNVNKSPTLGDKNAPITIIEYTDFDCPICKVASDEIVPKLKEEYIDTKKAKFIFKSLPLEHIHPNAFKKTEGAFCARDQQGDTAFFHYYDSLFENFGFSINLDNELVTIAKKNGLDSEQFRSCLSSRKFKKVITEDVLESNLIGSLGTPTWLIGRTTENGLTDTIKVSGLLEYSAFQTIVNKLLEKQL